MKPDLATLDRNLARLLCEAYAPIEARPAFRAELRARLEHALDERRPARPAAPTLLRSLPRLAAAAALVLFPLVAWFAWELVDRMTTGLDELLAAGHAAVREDAGAWRALTEDELVHGVDARELSALELCTPRAAGAELRAEHARLAVRADSRVSWTRAAAAPTAYLARGSLIAGLDAHAPFELLLGTPEGDLALAHGSLSLSVEPDRAAVFVRDGSARGPRGEPLPLATWVTLRGGELVTDAAPGVEDGVALVGGVPAHRSPVEPAPVAAATTAAPDGAAEPRAASAALTGRVASAASAEPAASFYVVLLRQVGLPDVAEPGVHAFGPGTSVDGRFALQDLRPGRYKVFVVADGFATWRRSGVELRAGDTAERPVDLTVELEAGAAVAGRVVDELTGRPLEGAFVVSEHDAPTQVLPLDLSENARAVGAAVTDHDGRFELKHLSSGTHILRASAREHGATWSAALSIEAGARTDDLVLELGPEAVVHGRALRDDGSPWSGAFVVASLIDYTFAHPCMTAATSATEADGTFELRGLAAGNYVVLNASEGLLGRTPRIRSVELEAGQRLRIDLPGDALGVRLTGTLTTADGLPVAAHDLTLVPLADESRFYSARTDADGRYELDGLPPGAYAGYVSREMATDMTLVGRLDVPAVPELAHDFRLGRASIAGRVTADGRPQRDVVVILERIDGDAPVRFAGKDMTDADGRYAFPGLALGEYDVTAFATTAAFGEERVEGLVLFDDQELDAVDLALFPGGSLAVRVTDAAGTPLEGALVSFTDARGRNVLFDLDERTDALGRHTVAGMKPGRWTVTARLGAASTVDHVQLSADVESVLHLILTP